jgi:two-component system chemotaxis response regulator CheY
MKSVLIVDDEQGVREVFADYFESELQFKNILSAQDGLDAFLECSKQKFDVITLDFMMPILNGADFLSALRNKPGPNQKTVVIMISGYLPELAEGIKTMDNTFFLDKPVDFTRLSRYVKMSCK